MKMVPDINSQIKVIKFIDIRNDSDRKKAGKGQLLLNYVRSNTRGQVYVNKSHLKVQVGQLQPDITVVTKLVKKKRLVNQLKNKRLSRNMAFIIQYFLIVKSFARSHSKPWKCKSC